MADTGMPTTAGRSAMPPLLVACRPGHWPKNLLVLAAPAAAGRLADPDVWPVALASTLCFVLASAAVYLVNDTVDRDRDAANPRTADRPIAAGQVRPRTALATAGMLVVASLGLLLAVTASPLAVGILGGYLLLNLGYNLGLKAVALVELLLVASGYVLRASLGGVATGVELSAWFLSVASFGALYVVVVKRVSEHDVVGHRAVLADYPPGLLEQVRSMALTATALTYTLWAFETGAVTDRGGVLVRLSVVPFLLALLRYALVTLRDGGASPERVIAGDRTLQVVGVVWVALLAVAFHA